MYGIIMATTIIVTMACVTIHRRHLMVTIIILCRLFYCPVQCLHIFDNFHLFFQVWGLFAPKYVFDVAGFVLTDILICLALLYYSCGEGASAKNKKKTSK